MYKLGIEYQATVFPFLIFTESGATFGPVNGGNSVFPITLTGKLFGDTFTALVISHFIESKRTKTFVPAVGPLLLNEESDK